MIFTRMSSFKFTLPLITVLDFSGSPELAKTFLASPPTRLMTSLKVLRIAWCGITDFPKSLQEQKIPNITRLDLSFNPLKCICELSWISDYVREGKLALENEKHTLCAKPIHLQNIPLLTATLCPFAGTLSTMTMPELTASTMETSNTHSIIPTSSSNTKTLMTPTFQVFPEWSTESSSKR